MFCPNCKRLMRPDRAAHVWRCSACGSTVPLGKGVEVGRSTPVARSVDVVDSGKVATLPKTQELCPKCGNGEAYWVLRQTRGSDEPETRIFECTKCGHKWREYQ
ncbi:MAG TPA: transcription factor S [Thermoplasmata archaeon]|jgi:transcription factor S|nr:transcription factor S [Thermoplasmata archaeon]